MKNYLLRLLVIVLFSCTSIHLFAQESSPEGKRRPVISFVEKDIPPPPKAMLGLGIGSQTGLSVLGAYYFDPFAIRASGGIGQEGWKGIQVDVSYLVFRYGASRHDVALIGGVSRFEDLDTSGVTQQNNEVYVGAAYTILYHGFHFQLGAAYGDGSYSRIILLFQAGYMFKLW